ncbi:MAG: flagella synthesis protein FlgN [Ectothiorhodospira sp.]
MTAESLPQRLERILNESVRHAGALESALQRESAALSSRDLTGMDAAVAEKQERVRQLEALTQEQTQLLTREGYASDAQGMERCLRDWDEEDILSPVWHRLVQIMNHCRHLNQVNGGVVDTARRRVDQAIHILRSGGETRTELYDPHGRSFSTTSSQSITKA